MLLMTPEEESECDLLPTRIYPGCLFEFTLTADGIGALLPGFLLNGPIEPII